MGDAEGREGAGVGVGAKVSCLLGRCSLSGRLCQLGHVVY
jgi:hypothetical protein